MAAELELIGWQWRFAFPTHKGDWHSVSRLPQTIQHGAPVVGHPDCRFETRNIYASPAGVNGPLTGQENDHA